MFLALDDDRLHRPRGASEANSLQRGKPRSVPVLIVAAVVALPDLRSALRRLSLIRLPNFIYKGVATSSSGLHLSLAPYSAISWYLSSMFNNQGYTWDQLVASSPTFATGSSGSSNFSASPSWTNTSLAASSPSPSGGYDALPPPPVEALAIDYDMLSETHIPYLRRAFRYNEAAMQTLQCILHRVTVGCVPEDSLLNQLIIQDASGYRCSVGTCQRHAHPYGRQDRAREHFRTEHLGAYFPCNRPGCSIRCKRVSDLRAHHLQHNADAPRYVCEHCGGSFPKRSNLNRHIETLHNMEAPRRRRGLDRPARY